MAEQVSSRDRIILVLAGATFVTIGLLLNEWLLACLFSPDGVLDPPTKAKIRVFNALAASAGFALVWCSQRSGAIKERLIRGARKYPRSTSLLFGLFLCVCMLLAGEFFFFFMNNLKHRDTAYFDVGREPTVETDDRLGYRPKFNSRYRETKLLAGKVVYDVVFEFDEYGRRITPVTHPESRTEFALFFGCSFVYGAAVKGDETLPFYFAELSPRHTPYNYGLNGYGPQQMLAKMEDEGFRSEVPQKAGVAVFTFIDDLVQRAVVSMHIYNGWGQNMPLYALRSDGTLVREGGFTAARPIQSFLYSALGKSQILRYFNVNIPPAITDEHIRTACRIIEESQKKYRSVFRSVEFYVLIYPGSKFADKVKSHMAHAGIRCLDYSSLFDNINDVELTVPGDGHPSAKAYQIVARKLSEDLALQSTVGEAVRK